MATKLYSVTTQEDWDKCMKKLKEMFPDKKFGVKQTNYWKEYKKDTVLRVSDNDWAYCFKNYYMGFEWKQYKILPASEFLQEKEGKTEITLPNDARIDTMVEILKDQAAGQLSQDWYDGYKTGLHKMKSMCLDIIQTYANQFKKITMTKEFKVERFKNGRGNSHLVVITEPAIEDIYIGTVVIVPYAEGFKDPVKVLLQVDENGLPKRANERFGIVSEYIYD